MAGVLDSKSRILDVILTELGRDQMNRGEFEVSFVTFSDAGAEYIDDGTGVISSIKDRLTFEALSSPNDEIIPEIDNEGEFLLTKKVSSTLTVNNGVLYEQTPNGFTAVDAFAKIDNFTDLTINRWNNLQILRSESSIPDFDVSSEAITLRTNLESSTTLKSDVSMLKPILIDPRFAGNVTTLYLPPVSLNNGSITPLRAFNRFGKENTMANTIGEIQSKSRASQRVELGTFTTFREYNIIAQAFMKKDQSVKKYLVVDGGEYKNEKNQVVMQVFHLGFIFKDENGTSKFSRSYSLVFHNEGE